MKNLLFIVLVLLSGCSSVISDNERYDACISLMNNADKNLQTIDSVRKQYGTLPSENVTGDLTSIHNILETLEHSINQVSDDNMRKTLNAQYRDLVAKSGYLTAIKK